MRIIKKKKPGQRVDALLFNFINYVIETLHAGTRRDNFSGNISGYSGPSDTKYFGLTTSDFKFGIRKTDSVLFSISDTDEFVFVFFFSFRNPLGVIYRVHKTILTARLLK